MGHDLKVEAIPTDRRKYTDWIKAIRLSTLLCVMLAIPLQARGSELHAAVQAGDLASVETLLARALTR